jgi:hypothetical protein
MFSSEVFWTCVAKFSHNKMEIIVSKYQYTVQYYDLLLNQGKIKKG